MSPFKKRCYLALLGIFAAGVLVIPPLLGAYLAGSVPESLLSFPPPPYPRETQPFSWPVFVVLATFVICVLTPALHALIAAGAGPKRRVRARYEFPWWGKLGIALTALSWVFAWTRFEWFAPLQPYTFTPLWLGYIVIVNALCWRRAGRCPMRDRPVVFAALFPVSALFWWFFEYLNRFVANWYYLGLEQASAFTYALSASIAFSTVLPAFVSTLRWMQTFRRFDGAFVGWRAVRIRGSAPAALALLAGVVGVLFALGFASRVFFPFVWVAPLFVLLSIEMLVGRRTILAPIACGDWRCVWQPAFAALFCGLVWELWNVGSQAHWAYSIPFVERFHVFAMPVLGYAGYLPFGVECAVVVGLLSRDIMWPDRLA